MVNNKFLTLRCYAEQENDGSWFAICLDLNIYARADNSKVVQEKLHEIVTDYINEAYTVDITYVNNLIPRKAPFLFWVRYFWIKLLSYVNHTRKNGAFEFIDSALLPTQRMVSLFLKYKNYSCRDVKRALINLGFKFVHQKGSHEQWEKISDGSIKYKVTVDCHRGEVKAKDVKSIVSQAGVSKYDFLKAIDK